MYVARQAGSRNHQDVAYVRSTTACTKLKGGRQEEDVHQGRQADGQTYIHAGTDRQTDR